MIFQLKEKTASDKSSTGGAAESSGYDDEMPKTEEFEKYRRQVWT